MHFSFTFTFRDPTRATMVVLDALKSIAQTLEIIMTKIADFAAAQKTYNDRISVAVDGLTTDVQALNDKITALQNSEGEITAEDQALLDGLQAQGEALASKLEALDGVTPPVVPTEPAAPLPPGSPVQ